MEPCFWVCREVPKASPRFYKLLIVNCFKKNQMAVGWKI